VKNPKVTKLVEKLREISYIDSANTLMEWDMEVYMPKKGAESRSQIMGYLAELSHKMFVSFGFERILNSAIAELKKGVLDENEAIIVRRTADDFEQEKKLPSEFVRECAELYSRAYTIWVDAKAKSDFSLFLPSLKRIVELERKRAEYFGYVSSPYDALLDLYEPKAKAEELSSLFDDQKAFLVPFIAKITGSARYASMDRKLLNRPCDLRKQYRFSKRTVRQMGFNFEEGRMDASPHPFTTMIHANDHRLTTRYQRHDVLGQALMSMIHEAGHGIYDQGLPPEHYGTPLSEFISMGIHESQSRIWENVVGRSLPFWKYLYPRFQKAFRPAFDDISLDAFYCHLNYAQPSLIRVDADEVTYNLHVILRFELERGLIEGTLKVEDLPELWNAKMKEYFGLEVPNDAHGVLQDVHWSGGSFGYFPTYALGNLYAAQLFDAAKKQIPGLFKQIENGQFAEFKEWLRINIHQHGRRYSPQELIWRATGESPSSSHFIDYLKTKYTEIYEF
jgi:carboxypeptidase Taq